MKTFKVALAIILIALGLYDLKAAVVVSDLTATEYAQKLSTSTVSWKVQMIAGYPSTSTREVTVTTNGTQSVHHLWSYPEQVSVGYDSSGNLNVRAGSTVLNAQPLLGFNMVLVRIEDTTSFFVTELRSNNFNGTSFRNLFADDQDTSIVNSDQISFATFGDVFALNSSFFQNSYDTNSILTVTGVWSVPETSTFTILSFLIAATTLLRRRQ
jgi:hypothetical protein